MVAAMVLGGLRRCEVLGLRLSDLRIGSGGRASTELSPARNRSDASRYPGACRPRPAWDRGLRGRA